MTPYREALRHYADATATPPAAAPRRLRLTPGLGAGLLLAAATAALALRPPTPPAPVDRVFTDQGEAPLGDAVRARWSGAGRVTGDARALALAWDAGELDLEVAPGQGVSLVVLTGEARARVVGTGFSVRRDAFGTEVRVRHGRVGVACQGAEEEVLDAGDARTCLPTSAAALLGRARAQMRRGDDPAVVLATVALAPRGEDAEADAELALVEAAELARAGRAGDALRVADTALATATHRRVELLRLATRLAVDAGGCALARPYVDALAALGEPTPCP